MRGQITVFLSLILVCVCSLTLGLVESARTAGARWYLNLVSRSSLDSLLSQYHRELWDRYRLLFLESYSDEELEKEYLDFIKSFEETENWYSIHTESVKAKNLVSSVEEGGKYLEKEILDYMRYGIFESDIKPEEGQELLDRMDEAGFVQSVSESYADRTAEAAKLEKALEDIAGSLRKQEEIRAKAMRRLADEDGGGFRRAADDLRKEIMGLTKLVRTYEREADRFSSAVGRSREQFLEGGHIMSSEVAEALEGELNHFDEYAEADGQRRREIEGLTDRGQRNLAILQRAVDLSEEVEETIEKWDDEEDGGDLDVSALWESVREKFSSLEIPSLSFRAGIKDSETKGLLERVREMAKSGLLSLVLPEGTEISPTVFYDREFPSSLFSGGEYPDSGPASRVLTDEYCSRFFTNFLNADGGSVKYEIEYLIAGLNREQDNLSRTLEGILAVRQGLNFIHILSDGEKRREAEALAASIAGAAAVTPLVLILAFFVMNVWALAESVSDIRLLLGGEKVPFFKDRGSWNVDLSGLLDLGRSKKLSESEHSRDGLDYLSYLKLLLLLLKPTTKYLRMMDMIQENVRENQPDFLMERCLYSVEIDVRARGKHRFLLPGFRGEGDGIPDFYSMGARVIKAY